MDFDSTMTPLTFPDPPGDPYPGVREAIAVPGELRSCKLPHDRYRQNHQHEPNGHHSSLVLVSEILWPSLQHDGWHELKIIKTCNLRANNVGLDQNYPPKILLTLGAGRPSRLA